MIVVDHIKKYYGARRALTDISFSIGEGEVVGFLGLNGAGKTTVFKILSGQLLPSAGRFTIDGIDGQLRPRDIRRRIGFLPDRPPLYEDMSVTQSLTYAGRLAGMTAAEVKARIPEVLASTNLTDVRDELVGWLSHGYRQRVGLAQAIVHRPKLLLLDEPISGLDPVQIVDMRKLIKSLAKEHTVLLSSHILGEISQTCDNILVLHEGHIVASGTEEALAKEMRSTQVELVCRAAAEKVRLVGEGVEGVDVLEVQPVAEGVVRMLCEAPTDEAREELIADLVDNGVAIRRFAEAKAGLESIFLRLTSGERSLLEAA